MKESKLIDLIVNHNVSAIVTLSEKLEVDPEQVIEMLHDLISAGKLQGTITEDGKRFFRSDAKISEAPVIEREDRLPEFLKYNTKPGYIVSILGAIILISGALLSIYATDIQELDFAAVLFFIGMLVLFAGLYLVAKRKTPD